MYHHLSHKMDLSESTRRTSCFRSMVKSDLSGSSLTLLARLKKKWQSFGRSKCREHCGRIGRQIIPEMDTHLPSNKGDAEDPGSSKVWVFKGGGVLCKSVVMDDGWLLIMEGLTEEPFLTSQKHVTGWMQVYSFHSISASTYGCEIIETLFRFFVVCCFYFHLDGEIISERFMCVWRAE